MYRSDGDRDVVHDRRYRLPERQWRDALGVERHHDRIALLNGDVRSLLEPPAAFLRHHAAVGTHDVYPAVVSTPGHAAAQGDVIVASQPHIVEMRGRILYLAEYHHLLLELRNNELVATSQDHVSRGPWRGVHQTRNIDDQPADGLGRAQLAEQRLAHRERRRPAPLTDRRGLKGEHGEIALHALGEQIELLLLAPAQAFARKHAAFGKGKVGQPAGPGEHRTECLTAPDGVIPGEAHLALKGHALLRIP